MVLGLRSLVEGSFVGFSGLIREPCVLLVGERLFFGFAGENPSFGVVVVDGGGSIGDH